MARFDGKRVLVTGGSNGIGLETARRIAEEGGKVLVTGTNPERLARAKAELPENVVVLSNDAGDPAAAEALAEAVTAELGGLDAIFFNAGYGQFWEPDVADVEAFDRMNEVNVRGPILQMAALSGLLADGGSVLLTSSIAPYRGGPIQGIYGATKASCRVLARHWATYYAPRGIRVNAIAPGPIETGFFDELGMNKEETAAFVEKASAAILLGRFGKSEEVAAVACFLLSEEASFVNGSEYVVDGGMTLH